MRTGAGRSAYRLHSCSGAGGFRKRLRPPIQDKFSLFPNRLSSRLEMLVPEEGRDVLKSIKAMGVYEVAALLISVFWFVGCSGRVTGASSNRPTVLSANHASSKFLHVVNSMEERVRGFAIDAAMRALTAVGSAAASDDAPVYAAATLDGKFLYVANAGTKATRVSGYRIDGLRGELTPMVPGAFATRSSRPTWHEGRSRTCP